MYQDLWVASDGITTLRFSDEQSALLYCAQTGWPADELLKIRTQLQTLPDSEAVTVEPWLPRMHPEIDMENSGTWSEDNVWLPPARSMEGGETEDDLPLTYTKAYIGKLGFIVAVTGWEFRDLAASVDEMIDAAWEFAKAANAEGRSATWQEAMAYCFEKTGKGRIVD